MPPVVIPKYICLQDYSPVILPGQQEEYFGQASSGPTSTEEVLFHSILAVCRDFMVKRTVRWLNYPIPTFDFLNVKVNRLALLESPWRKARIPTWAKIKRQSIQQFLKTRFPSKVKANDILFCTVTRKVY